MAGPDGAALALEEARCGCRPNYWGALAGVVAQRAHGLISVCGSLGAFVVICALWWWACLLAVWWGGWVGAGGGPPFGL